MLCHCAQCESNVLLLMSNFCKIVWISWFAENKDSWVSERKHLVNQVSIWDFISHYWVGSVAAQSINKDSLKSIHKKIHNNESDNKSHSFIAKKQLQDDVTHDSLCFVLEQKFNMTESHQCSTNDYAIAER